MRRHAVGNMWRGLTAVAALWAVSALCGCAGGRQEFDASRVQTNDQISAVAVFWDQRDLWLYRPDNTDVVAGFQMNVYFLSGRSGKGVFVPGDIVVKVFVEEMTEQGQQTFLAHQARLTEQEAVKWRYTKRGTLGYYYGLRIDWPRDRDALLAGREIEVRVEYEADSGRLVRSTAHRLNVPRPRPWERSNLTPLSENPPRRARP